MRIGHGGNTREVAVAVAQVPRSWGYILPLAIRRGGGKKKRLESYASVQSRDLPGQRCVIVRYKQIAWE